MKTFLKKIYLLLLTACCAHFTYAQQEQFWAFGFGAGLNFSSGTPVPVNTAIDAAEGCASVCNSSGALLFYTNGTDVWNATDNIMPAGGNLQPDGAGTISQAAVIIPMPDSSNKYYVFSLTNNHRLFYSVVDMNLDGGLGDVIPGRKGILVDTGLTEQMTAVAGDDCNIWVLTVTQLGILKAFRVDYAGVTLTPVTSPVVQVSGWIVDGIVGCMSVAPNRQKLSIARNNSLSLYDFDPATGTCSNAIVLDTVTVNNYATSFSPDNSKVYFTNFSQGVWQYDLSQPTPAQIVASKVTLAWNGYLGMKLAADGKIYTVNRYGGFGNYLVDIIHAPNLAGPLCQLTSGILGIGGLNNGLPNVVPAFIQRGISGAAKTVAGGCAAIDIILQADTPGMHYVWNTGQTGATLQVTDTGRYWVRYEAPCATHMDTFRVVYGFSGVNFPQLVITEACKGSANGNARVQRVPGDNTVYSFSWTDTAHRALSVTDTLGPVPAGNYWLQVHAGPGCDTVLPVLVPEVAFHASFIADTLACAGADITFNNTSPAHFTGYSWSFGDGTVSILAAPVHPYPYPGRYPVSLVAYGPVCRDTVHRTITIDPPGAGFAFTKEPAGLCMGDALVLAPQLDDTTTYTGFSWEMGDGSGFRLPGLQPFSYACDRAGMMYIRARAGFRACPDVYYTDSIMVYAFPVVDLGPDTVLCYQGAPVYLQNLAARMGGSTYRWSTGDTASQLKVLHPGQYSLWVTSAAGCATTANIEVKKDCYIDIPNSFTPNGDGNNDYFFPRQLLSRGLYRFRMKIFNRWGQVIFETTNSSGRGWDGRFNGQEQPEGVYLYLVEAELKNGFRENYNANVTLLR